ncbi:MAG TPA: cytochrome D1 domain-containing protein [Candidatus Limnocylindrales bacterium]|nr:cytochrome D1 domain-containing protein [Candidatus Limnocylindrales bacterium]
MRWLIGFLALATFKIAAASVPLSPTALIASQDNKALYLACATANRVLCFDIAKQRLSATVATQEQPSGLALSADGLRLYVTCAAPKSQVCIVDVAKWEIVGTIPVGHTALAPVISPDGKTLYVCNRFNDDVSMIDLAAKKELCRIPVQREPVAADITKDGKYLLVSNHLPTGRADVDYVAAAVSVIDLTAGKVVKELQLPNGSGSLNDIRISPDGKYAALTHIVGRFNRLPTRPTEGWINANALTIIDMAKMRVYGTTLLDDHYRGAANPWGVAWSHDSATLVVTHAGTHEISVIDFQKLLARLPPLPSTYNPVKTADYYATSKAQSELPDDLPYFVGNRFRVKLPTGDLGPRAVVIVGHTAYVANYFSDTLSVIDLSTPKPKVESILLGPKQEMDAVRKGEFCFHDAGLCFEGWQSCSSCHPGDARADGLNWDLLNDGIGNPKNAKSLLLATRTSPVMWLGVRSNATVAIRAGIQSMLFTIPSNDVVDSIGAYLDSLKPVPSPYLVIGKLSKPAERGEKVFIRAGCADCHVSGLYTDQLPHDVGTRASFDKPTDRFYTPTLIEVWRTAPYLHDGSAATIRDVITTRNPEGKHGDVTDLSKQEIDDLCLYVLSL